MSVADWILIIRGFNFFFCSSDIIEPLRDTEKNTSSRPGTGFSNRLVYDNVPKKTKKRTLFKQWSMELGSSVYL